MKTYLFAILVWGIVLVAISYAAVIVPILIFTGRL